MSDARYKLAILHGIRQFSDAREWPENLEAFGPRRSGRPFARCRVCTPGTHITAAGSFTRYGETPLCLAHALARAAVERRSRMRAAAEGRA